MSGVPEPAPAPPRIKAFPLAWVTSGRRLLLVGGCGGATCRVHHALAFDWARIHAVVPPGSEPLCEACRRDPRVAVDEREPEPGDTAAADLAIESTFDGARAARLAGWCKRDHTPLNAMDKVEHCDLYYCSLLLRGPLVVAIGSGGESPALSAALRRRMEECIGPGWGHAAEQLAELRRRLPNTAARAEALKKLARDAGFLRAVEEDDLRGMEALIREVYDRFSA